MHEIKHKQLCSLGLALVGLGLAEPPLRSTSNRPQVAWEMERALDSVAHLVGADVKLSMQCEQLLKPDHDGKSFLPALHVCTHAMTVMLLLPSSASGAEHAHPPITVGLLNILNSI